MRIKNIVLVLLCFMICATCVSADETEESENNAEILENDGGGGEFLETSEEPSEEPVISDESIEYTEEVEATVPKMGEFVSSVIYNEEHTIATVIIEYNGECSELSLNNEEEIIPFVEAGVWKVNLEQGDWEKKVAFDVLSNGMICLEINVWNGDVLVGTKEVKCSVVGLNNDSLLFEPNQAEQATYEITSSDIGTSDARNMTLSYETNVSFTWSIPTELPMADIEDDLTVTVNNSNLATETALRIRVASNNDYNLIEPESSESLSYIVTDLSGNKLNNGDVILDHLYNQNSTSNTIHFDLTQMPVLSGKYEDTLTFTASVERLLSDLYSGQVVTLSNLGTTHNLTNMKIYGISKQDGTPTPDNPVEIQSVVNPSVTVSGKNLLNPTLETTTQNGVTCTQNIGSDGQPDGTYTLNGTASDHAFFYLKSPININCSNVRLIGNFENSNCRLFIINGSWATIAEDTGKGANISQDISSYTLILAVMSGNSVNNVVIKPMITTDFDATYNDFEPYISNESQSATLDYTLNAIPVSSGGNVTVNGQQYIADYVDIENKKLVRNCASNIINLHYNNGDTNIGNYRRYYVANVTEYKPKLLGGSDITYSICTHFDRTTQNHGWAGGYKFTHAVANPESNGFYFVMDESWENKTLNEFVDYMNSLNATITYALDTPVEIDLTDEEVQAFKDLYTYSPTTAVSCSSDQLTPYIEFGLS